MKPFISLLFLLAFILELMSQNQYDSTYKVVGYFHAKKKMYGMLLMHNEKIDTIYLLSTQPFNPLSFCIDTIKKECRIVYEMNLFNSFFGRTELETFYYSGNGIWKTSKHQPFLLSTKITYSTLPSDEVLNRTTVRSNYVFEDFNTLKYVKYEKGKEIKEKILLNDNYKIIKLEEK